MSEEYDDRKGGEPGYEGDGPNLRFDDFVGRIVQDPNEPPDVTLLSGYLGSSSEEAHVRLYLDEGLSRYVEIPEKAILHTQELSPEQSPLGGSLVWIDSGAEVVHGAAGSERRRATFLEGQIAQDYMGGEGGSDFTGGGITTQTRACVAVPQTLTPACGAVSQSGPCIPKTEVAVCRTLTGILCTRFGPSCRRTVFEPACTFAGPLCGRSVYYPCVTQNQPYCAESGFVGCNPPVDFTIAQGQIGGPAHLPPPPTSPLACPDPPTLSGFGCGGLATAFNCPSIAIRCPTQDLSCQTRFAPACQVSRVVFCPDTRNLGCQVETAARCPSVAVRCPSVGFNCVSVAARCPTMGEPRCFASRSLLCPDTVAGCQFDSAFCGFEQPGGFDPARGAEQGFEPMGFAMQHGPGGNVPTQTPACPGGHPTPNCPTMPTQTSACVTEPPPTETCTPGVPTQLRDCQTQTSGCGNVTQWAPHCRAGEGGGFAAAQAQFPPSRVVRCPSAVDLCPTRYNCPSQFVPCQSQLVRCPSALDACPTRFGCNETAFCGQSVACFPGGGGGGFNPGGGGFGGGF